VEVRLADERDHPALTAVLARAFEDDPTSDGLPE
jgi:hypothetical protein